MLAGGRTSQAMRSWVAAHKGRGGGDKGVGGADYGWMAREGHWCAHRQRGLGRHGRWWRRGQVGAAAVVQRVGGVF